MGEWRCLLGKCWFWNVNVGDSHVMVLMVNINVWWRMLTISSKCRYLMVDVFCFSIVNVGVWCFWWCFSSVSLWMLVFNGGSCVFFLFFFYWEHWCIWRRMLTPDGKCRCLVVIVVLLIVSIGDWWRTLTVDGKCTVSIWWLMCEYWIVVVNSGVWWWSLVFDGKYWWLMVNINDRWLMLVIEYECW